MQADKLPPLPEWCLDDERAAYVLAGMSGPQYRNDMQDYARAALSAHGQPVVGDALRDSFHDGVILALQVLNASGDCGSADYTELVKCCGLDALVRRAEAEDMMELSGLGEYTKELRETAALTGADHE